MKTGVTTIGRAAIRPATTTTGAPAGAVRAAMTITVADRAAAAGSAIPKATRKQPVVAGAKTTTATVDGRAAMMMIIAAGRARAARATKMTMMIGADVVAAAG